MNEAENSSVIDRFVDQFWTDWERGEHRTLEEYQSLFKENLEAISAEYMRLQKGIGARASKKDRMVGPFRLVSKIGRGGQGTVWLAEDTRLGRKVALKILPGTADEDRETVERFRREARIAASLEHPNICPIYGANFDGQELYIAMRYIDGAPLSKTIEETWSEEEDEDYFVGWDDDDATDELPQQEGKRPDYPRVLALVKIIETSAKALHVAHEAGIVHRDIKPSNIMLEEDGRPVVLDFGLAHADRGMDRSLTRIGDFMGTPAYMSPEQLLANRIKLDRRTDIYSLGVCLFQCLTGKLPFRARTSEDLYNMILSRQAVDVRELNPDVSAELADVVHRSLAKDRNERYPDGAAMAAAIDEALTGTKPSEPPRPTTGRIKVDESVLADDPSAGSPSPETVQRAADATVRSADQEEALEGEDARTRRISHADDEPKDLDQPAESGTWADLNIIREIGRGGMGVVYEAEQISLKRRVAVKVLAHHRLDESEARTRFIEEARLSSRLQHPNIVPIYNVGVDEDKLFYVMELVQGVSLDAVIRALRAWFFDGNVEATFRLPGAILDILGLAADDDSRASAGSSAAEGKRLDRVLKNRAQRRALQWLVESTVHVAHALAHAHRSRVVHADIKPSNLIFDMDGRLRIVDFGLARIVQDEAESASEGPGGGTLRYMSPEQVRGDARAISPLADVYSLGATLYELVTLQPLHGSGSPAEVVQKKLRGEVERPRDLNPGVHRDLEFIVLKALAPRQRLRYQSCTRTRR